MNRKEYKELMKTNEGRLQIIKELKNQNKILLKILDSSYDGIYITDGQGYTLYFNDAFMRISGFLREETMGKKTQDLVDSGYLPKSCSAAVIETLKPVSMIIKYKNGTPGMLNGEPVFDRNGKLVRTILNVRDMSELNRLNKDLEKAEVESNSYKQELREVQMKEYSKNKIIYKSKDMEKAIEMAIKSSNVDYPILIQGESGCGKDVLANFIHSISNRRKTGSYIKVNCGAIPENLMESELFGYERGAFTGALEKGKAGKFELAQGGTFLLDEIGDLPLKLQVKLLDVIQENAVTRIGGSVKIPLNVRIIAATNKDLRKMIDTGEFRLDLFYRLNVLPIHIPPLRSRREDIIVLAESFLDNENKKLGTKKTFSVESYDILFNYNWPGNARELLHVIERLLITTTDDVIDIKRSDLLGTDGTSFLKQKMAVAGIDEFIKEDMTLKEFSGIMETEYIKKKIETSSTLKEAAEKMGIDLSTLVRKKKKYEI